MSSMTYYFMATQYKNYFWTRYFQTLIMISFKEIFIPKPTDQTLAGGNFYCDFCNYYVFIVPASWHQSRLKEFGGPARAKKILNPHKKYWDDYFYNKYKN